MATGQLEIRLVRPDDNFVLVQVLLEVLVLPPYDMVLMGIVSCKKCIFFQRQVKKGWVIK